MDTISCKYFPPQPSHYSHHSQQPRIWTRAALTLSLLFALALAAAPGVVVHSLTVSAASSAHTTAHTTARTATHVGPLDPCPGSVPIC